MPEAVKLSERLQTLFAKTKLVCFGRYALEVPLEAQLIMGRVGVPPLVEVLGGDLEARRLQVVRDVAEIKLGNNGAEITYNGAGPVEESWQLRYYDGKAAKVDGSLSFKTYLTKGVLTFIFGGSMRDEPDNEQSAAARQAQLANNFRLRGAAEIPNEPGFCIEHGFVADNLYADQETASAGIYLPSFPDVTFSISSNKDAYSDYPPADYERLKLELSMLARIEQAKKDQGGSYPSRTLLREGKRDVQHWHGEESLIKRDDGAHDFEWALVGRPKDVAYPAEFGVRMYSKVAHNSVGAAKSVSVSDDEAVALWDRLLAGLKFRVKVPGAPEGSYFTPSEKAHEK